MNLVTEQMREYATFLEEISEKIVNQCNALEGNVVVALHCMDQKSGLVASRNMLQNIENIKASVPYSDDAAQRLIKAMKLIDSIDDSFGGKVR